MAELDRMMSVTKVAEIFGRAPRTIRSWISRGVFAPIKVGNAVFIPTRQVDEVLSRTKPTEGTAKKKAEPSRLHGKYSKSTTK